MRRLTQMLSPKQFKKIHKRTRFKNKKENLPFRSILHLLTCFSSFYCSSGGGDTLQTPKIYFYLRWKKESLVITHIRQS